jgi:hypothetical protein
MISQGARRQSDDAPEAEMGLDFLFISHDIAAALSITSTRRGGSGRRFRQVARRHLVQEIG